jgi:hypothetical protein
MHDSHRNLNVPGNEEKEAWTKQGSAMPSRDDKVDLAPDSEDMKLIPLPDVTRAPTTAVKDRAMPSHADKADLSPILPVI